PTGTNVRLRKASDGGIRRRFLRVHQCIHMASLERLERQVDYSTHPNGTPCVETATGTAATGSLSGTRANAAVPVSSLIAARGYPVYNAWHGKDRLDPNTAASARVRAADSVLDHAAKRIELEDIEARVAELERAAGASNPAR